MPRITLIKSNAGRAGHVQGARCGARQEMPVVIHQRQISRCETRRGAEQALYLGVIEGQRQRQDSARRLHRVAHGAVVAANDSRQRTWQRRDRRDPEAGSAKHARPVGEHR